MSDRVLSALRAVPQPHHTPPPRPDRRGGPVPVSPSQPGGSWAAGMTRGAWDYPFRNHRTLAEIDGGGA